MPQSWPLDIFPVNFTYLRVRERERGEKVHARVRTHTHTLTHSLTFQVLVHCPNACNSGGQEPELKMRAGNTVQVSLCWEKPSSLSHHSFQGLHWQEAGVQGCSWESNPGTPKWDESIFITRFDICCPLFHKGKSIVGFLWILFCDGMRIFKYKCTGITLFKFYRSLLCLLDWGSSASVSCS